MSELPKGWIDAEIGVLCNLINGKAFKPTDWVNQGLPIVRIQNLNNPDARFNHFNSNVQEKFLIDKGQLLFAWSGTPGTSFGAHIWNGGKAVLNQHIFKVNIDESSIDKDFFKYAINQKLGELISKAHGGVGLRHVTKGKFEKTNIHFPPLNEQKRISEKLDQILEEVGSAKARLDQIPTILKNFRKSVLHAAINGKLTDDWRDHNNSNATENARELLDRFLQERKKRFEKEITGRKKFKEPVEPDLSYNLFQVPSSWIICSVSKFAECLDSQRIPVKRDDRKRQEGKYPYYGANGVVDYVDK